MDFRINEVTMNLAIVAMSEVKPTKNMFFIGVHLSATLLWNGRFPIWEAHETGNAVAGKAFPIGKK